MAKNSGYRTNIIGAGEVGCAVSVDMEKNSIHKTNSFFWDTKGNEVIGTTALPLYGAFISEGKCRLFGDVSGKKILEIGCGRGIRCNIWANAEHRNCGGWIYRKNKSKRQRSI